MEDEFKIVPITSSRIIDMTGKTYGRLKVLGLSPIKKGNKRYWVCQCSCGKKTVVRGNMLRSGITTSCGCYKREQSSKRLTTHGKSGTRLYRIWRHMKKRCSDPNADAYMNYGERGVEVCKGWEESFEVFADWAESNGYRDDLSIDRIDNDGNYEPSNCRWATDEQQANNTRLNVNIEYNGETHSLAQWAKILNMPKSTLYARHNRGDKGDRLFRPTENDIEYNGERHSLSSWARILNMPEATLYARHNRGDKGDRLFRPTENDNGSRKIEYNGERHSLSSWARILNMPKSTLYSRHNRGDTGERLFRPVGK